MSNPDERARDKDRDAAIKIVEAAWAHGQIIEADRDKRVEQLQRAQTLQEIAMTTHDLERSAPAREEPPADVPAVYRTMPFTTPAAEVADESPPVAPAPPPDVRYGPPMSGSGVSSVEATPAKVSKLVFIVPLVVVAVIGIAIAGSIAGLVSGSSDSSSSPTYAPGEEPGEGDVNVISESGYADLVDAVAESSGRTAAFSAVLYPTYAVVALPVDATTQRENRWYWDGRDLSDQNSKGTSTDERFDLRSVEPEVIVRLVAKVRRASDDPTSWYAVVRAPQDDGTMIWAYASNEYNESVYLGARRDGTIVYDSTKQ